MAGENFDPDAYLGIKKEVQPTPPPASVQGFDPDAFLGQPKTLPQASQAPQSFSPDAFLSNKPSLATVSSTQEAPPMPGILDATMHGLGAAYRGVKQTATIGSTKPQEAHDESPAAAPFEMADLTSPISRGLPKVAYRLAEGTPTLAAGVAGGIAGGAAAGPPGAIVGGAAGSALGSVAQSVGPIFAEELKRTPDNPDAAWDRTVKLAATNGVFSAAGWAAMPLRIAGGPLKQIMFQAFGIQPALSVANKATSNIITDQPITQDMWNAITEGVVMAAVPAVGHAIVNKALGVKPPSPRMSDPDMQAVANRIVDGPDNVRHSNFDEFYTKVKDDLHPIKTLVKSLMEKGGIQYLLREDDPYVLSRLTRGSSGKASSWIDYETFDYSTGQRNGDSLRKALNPVKNDIDAFNSYLVSKRAVELDARGIDTGVPLAEAQRVSRNYRGAFEQTARSIHDYQDRLLDYMRDSGILNDEQVNAMRQANHDYVPFYRLMDEPESNKQGSGTGLRTWNPIKKIEGSERQIINPIESIIKNTHLMIELAERNRAMTALARLAERVPGADEFIRKSTAVRRPIELSQTEMQRLFGQAGVPNAYGPPSNFTIFRPDAFRPSPNEIALYRNGKREVWQVDSTVAEATKGMDARGVGLIEKIISTPAKTLRAGVTLVPDFFVRNMGRDQLMAFALSNNGYIPVYDFFKGMRSILGGRFDAWMDSRGGHNAISSAISGILGKGEDYKNWLKSGGANAALISGDRNYIAGEMRRLAESGSYKEFKNVINPANILSTLQATSELFESATRVGDFARAMKRGKNLQEAGFDSREVTLDFWRIGAKTRAFNNISAFWNASYEGLDRTWRGFKDDKLRTLMKVGVGITAPSALLAWANWDDERVQELPASERDIFWHVPTDKWTPVSDSDVPQRAIENGGIGGKYRRDNSGRWYRNDGTVWKIPKPFEVGIIFGSLPERLVEAYIRDNPDAWRNFGKTIQKSIMLEPGTWIPTSVRPGLEQLTNKNFFTERDLVPKSLQGIRAREQYTPYTTESSKLIGQGLGKITDTSFSSPVVIENYVRAWTGGLGMQAMNMADSVLTKSGIIKQPPKPKDTLADTFFIKGFVSRYPGSNAESIQKFYDEYTKRSTTYNTARYLDKRGDTEGAAFERSSYANERANAIYQNINKMQKRIRDIYLEKDKTPEQKRQEIDGIYFSMIEMAKVGNGIFRNTKVPGG